MANVIKSQIAVLDFWQSQNVYYCKTLCPPGGGQAARKFACAATLQINVICHLLLIRKWAWSNNSKLLIKFKRLTKKVVFLFFQSGSEADSPSPWSPLINNYDHYTAITKKDNLPCVYVCASWIMPQSRTHQPSFINDTLLDAHREWENFLSESNYSLVKTRSRVQLQKLTRRLCAHHYSINSTV